MKNLVFLFFIVAMGLAQLSLLDIFKIFNVKPDLLLISAFIASLFFELRWALLFGLFAGIFKDVFCQTAFGINTLLFPLWILLTVELAKKITIDYNLIRLILLLIIAIGHHTITGIIFIYLGNFIGFGIFLRIVIVESIYTAVALPLIFKITTLILDFRDTQLTKAKGVPFRGHPSD